MSVSHRTCNVQMQEEENEFGFLLEKTHHPYRICLVENNSPAERGGLRVNDCILKVNGEDVTQMSFSQIIDKIKNSGRKVDLVVANRDTLLNEMITKFNSKANVPLLEDCLSSCVREPKNTLARKEKKSLQKIGAGNSEQQNNRETLQNHYTFSRVIDSDTYEDREKDLNCRAVSNQAFENTPDNFIVKEELQLDVRLCILRLRTTNISYGFNLGYLNTGEHIIENVEPSSPAFYAGLKGGDRLIEVDGFNIENSTHAQVVERIKTVFEICRQAPLKLLVVDEITYIWCKNQNIQINLRSLKFYVRTIEGNNESKEYANSLRFSMKRSFRLHKRKGFLNDLGFDFITNGEGEHIVKNVQPGSPVHSVGLKVNDRILEVNNCNVKQYSHYRLRALLNSLEADRLTMVVASERNYRLMERKFPVSTMKLFNFEATESGNIGIEFLTRKTESSYKHKIITVESSSAAEEVGLCVGDRLLEVNGNDVSRFDGNELRNLLHYMFKRKCLKILASGRSMICNSSYCIEPISDRTNQEIKVISLKVSPNGNVGFATECSDSYPRIIDVQENSEARMKGIHSGDVLISFDNIDLNEADENFIKRLLNNSCGKGTVKAVCVDFRSELLSNSNFQYISSTSNNNMDMIGSRKSNHLQTFDSPSKLKSKSLLDLSQVEGIKGQDDEIENETLKFCTLLPDKIDGFGVEIVSKRNGIITFENVQPNSVADLCGVKNGDIIAQIDGTNVSEFTNHKELIERFKESSNQNKPITVGLRTSSSNMVRKFQSIPNLSNHFGSDTIPGDPVPRCCMLRLRNDKDWGFDIKPARGTDCPIVYNVVPGSAAHRGGIAMFDMVLAFDRLSVQNYDSNWPSFYIKQALHRRQMELLVLTESAYWIYKKRGGVLRREDMNIFDYEQPLSECFTKYRPRLCVFKGKCMKKSLGFAIFRHKPNTIASVDKHSPSSKAKLKKDDIIIEINDITLTSYPDVSVSSLISHFKKRGILKMLVVDQASFEWYSNKCIPLNSYLTFLSTHVVEK